jgi:predicted permease
VSDLRYAIRSFVKAPLFTAVVLVTLALGIGANTAIFGVIHAVLIAPLPYPGASALVRVAGGTSAPDMHDWIERTASFSAIGGFRRQSFDYAGTPAERIDGALVTPGLLGVLGSRAIYGRLFTDEDSRAGAEKIVAVSAGFWRTRLGADPGAVGRTIEFNGASHRIAGVLDPAFELPAVKADVLAPFDTSSREARARGAHTLQAILRLRPGVTRARAQQEMDALAVGLEAQYPRTNRDVRFRLVPLKDAVTGSIREPLLLLLATVGFVLLIACVNVANLLVARGTARRAEIAVRSALGASRRQIARLLLTESLLLAAAGGLCGLVVAWWITRAVIGLAPADVPRLDGAGLNVRALAFTATACLGTGLLFGLVPAWAAVRRPLASSTPGQRVTGRSRAGTALMIVEIALALVLVAGAGLLLRSFVRLTRQPIGFDTARLLTANVTPGAQRYYDIPTRTRMFQAFEESLRAVPGVRGVALTTQLPVGGSPVYHNLAFEGRPAAPGTEPEVYYRGVSDAYFDVLDIPLRAGRRFDDRDRAGAPLVAIVNEAFVREYYPAESPLGRRIRWASGNGQWITIVGVAGDVRGLGLERADVAAVHVPYAQEQMPWRTFMDVAVRFDGDAAPVAAGVRRALEAVDRTIPVTRLRTMDDVLRRSVADRRFSLYLLGGFGIVSLLLAAAGTYGVMSHAVAARTREIGVRLALGATPADVFRLVVGGGMAVAAAGVIAGLAAAAALSRILSGMLFEIPARDGATFAAAAVVLLAAAAVATGVPARRAARVDPLIVLRRE